MDIWVDFSVSSPQGILVFISDSKTACNLKITILILTQIVRDNVS